TIINASIENVRTTQRGTNIGNGKEVIYTVEHVLSACAGLDIDDLDMELNEAEPPAMDGSAMPFAEAFLKTGIKIKNDSEKNFLTCEKEFKVQFGDAEYHVKPYNGVFVRMVYKNAHKLVGTQIAEFEWTPENYVSQIAPARTFGFMDEVEQLKAKGLALGGSLDNAVIIDKDRILTSSGSLRFENEFARHKLLDLLGDLKLTGKSLKNIWIEAISTSHSANIDFVREFQK
ncbi:MAG: UDP-3-O-acyl-N-acetylglucosamine deacetylase, partial [Elusimicrobiota bacterium]